MITHDITKLPKYQLYASFKPGMLSIPDDNTDLDVMDTIANRYHQTLRYNKRRINDTLRPLYGKPLKIKDSSVGTMIIKIKEVISSTDRDVDQIAKDIREYLGYPCSFYRRKGTVLSPVQSDIIVKAWRAVQEKLSKEQVKEILYGND